jgi:hypothetical protein
VAKLPPVSTAPAANLPPVSTRPAANFATSFTSVVDTGGKFATGVNNAGCKFAAGVNDTGGKLPLVSKTPVANNGNNIRLQIPQSELEDKNLHIYVKGTESRDFLLLVLFMNQFPPRPRVLH